jgi:DNA-binding transcriptional regulator YdaS (Cro superfamily)
MPKAPDPEVTRLVAEAIALAGSEEKLAKITGYSQNAIWHAKRRGRVTAEMATAIAAATDDQVPRHKLRPDLFTPGAPAPTSAAA